MSEMYLNSLASNHANWLSARQSLISSNVANANTPGFKALDVKAFEDTKGLFSRMAQTDEAHLSSGIGNVAGVATGRETPWDVYHSGGNVSLPQEMIKSGEVAGAYELNTTVMKSFHRMVVSVFGT